MPDLAVKCFSEAICPFFSQVECPGLYAKRHFYYAASLYRYGR